MARYRSWSYTDLVRLVEQGCVETAEGTDPDGTEYQLALQVFWDDQRHGNVRVVGDLCAEPQRRLFGFLPIYSPNITCSFIVAPDGSFVGEGG